MRLTSLTPLRPLLCGSALALLVACGGTAPTLSQTHPPEVTEGQMLGVLKAVQVSGTVIYPPQAGEAIFGRGNAPQGLRAQVTSGGQFELTLPARFAVDQATPFPLIPAGLWSDTLRSSCAGKPEKSDAAAPVYVLNRGLFQVGGAELGELVPMQRVLAGQTLPESRIEISRLELYVYSPKALTMTGTLDCTLERVAGSVQKARVELAYQFVPGWNMVQFRTEQPSDDALSVTLAKTVPLAPLAWRFSPTQR